MTSEELLRQYSEGKRDFSGADLYEAFLSGANLIRAQLKEVIGYSPEVAAACAPSLRDVTPAGTRTPELCEAKMLEWSAGMLAKLKSGTAKGRPDWHNKTETSVEALVLHLFAEIHEFFAAGAQAERMREAADVANVVHMLAEHIGNDTTTAARALAAAKMVRQTYVG